MEKLIDLVQRIVQLPSVNPPGEEGQVSEYIAEWARRAGLEVEVEEVFPGRPNVYIWLRGDASRPRLILNGHTDVVPATGEWRHPPFAAQINGNILYGRGSADMKGGLAAMLMAAKAIKESGVSLKGDFAITAVVDEESGGAGTLQALKHGIRGHFAIVGEPTELKAVTASKGDVDIEIKTFGKAAHSSLLRRV